METDFVDAPESVGQLFLMAVRERNANLLRSVMSQGWLMGKYSSQLSAEEHAWVAQQNLSDAVAEDESSEY